MALRSCHQLFRLSSSRLFARTTLSNKYCTDDKKSKLESILESSVPQDPPEFPSDIEADIADWKRLNNVYRSQGRHAYRPRGASAEDTTIFLFPGQGSQFIGMGRELTEHTNVSQMFTVASDIFGYDLLDMCLNGPKDSLDKTIHCQPAVVVTSLAAVEALRDTSPQAITQCISTAGYSVGEITALVFADALSFEDAMHVVKKRASLMQRCSEEVPSGMMTVILGADHKLNYAMHTARLYCSKKLGMEYPVCSTAIDMYPEVKVIAGNIEALDFIEENGRDFGIRRRTRVPVSGAFHTPLMRAAKKEYLAYLQSIEIKRPVIPTFSNVTSRRHSTPARIRSLLADQLCEPVKWEQIMHVLYSRSKDSTAFPRTYEVGPGQQLGAMLKKTNLKAHNTYQSVRV